VEDWARGQRFVFAFVIVFVIVFVLEHTDSCDPCESGTTMTWAVPVLPGAGS
jgi:hypothetical protein